MRLQVVHDLKAIHVGHLNISDHQVVWRFYHLPNAFHSIRRRRDPVSFTLQQELQIMAQARFILDEENGGLLNHDLCTPYDTLGPFSAMLLYHSAYYAA